MFSWTVRYSVATGSPAASKSTGFHGIILRKLCVDLRTYTGQRKELGTRGGFGAKHTVEEGSGVNFESCLGLQCGRSNRAAPYVYKHEVYVR